MKIMVLLIGSFAAALISGAAGFGGSLLLLPIVTACIGAGAAVFLSLDLAPVAYIASEAVTATAMHLLKIVIYSKLTDMSFCALLLGFGMGLCMIAGTYCARHFIKNMEKGKFQIYAAILLCVVGVYMMVFGD